MYYPKSQILPNLYTNGNEFIYKSTGLPYIGYYYKTSKGEYFTGRNQDDRPNEPLLLFFYDGVDLNNLPSNTPATLLNDESIIVNDYINIKQSPTPYIPVYNPTFPTQQDYQNREFQRYFCKKTNEIIYIEIDKETYTKLVTKDPQIEYSLYQPFTITWILTGDKQQVARVNKNIVELAMVRQKLPKFNLYLKEDYTKYYQ
jgi:hypothetical protein